MSARINKITCGIETPGIALPGFVLPAFKLAGEIELTPRTEGAAWELYIELCTRIATEPLADNQGLLREALSSLYALFAETREILKRYGPEVGRPHRKGYLTIGQLAIVVLNEILRPVLAYWHPILKAHEDTRPATVSPVDHERAWAQNKELCEVLKMVQKTLSGYSHCLASAAKVPHQKLK